MACKVYINILESNLDVIIRTVRVALEAQYTAIDLTGEPEAEPIGVVLRVLEMAEKYAHEKGV